MVIDHSALSQRGYRVLSQIKHYLPLPLQYGHNLFIAGSSIASPTAQFCDVDIFCQQGVPLLKLDAPVLAETVNATTYATSPWPIQVCLWRAATLEELINSFDFTHIQAGMEIYPSDSTWSIKRTCCTAEYVSACVGHSTEYTNVPKPLASLLRLAKYHARGVVTPEANAQATITLLVALIKTGFKSEADFRSQLVGLSGSLGLDLGSDALTELYRLLAKEDGPWL